jgi:hypothetical protein
MGWLLNYQHEARVYAKYILKEKPNGRIAILYQNDDYGKDCLKGLKDGLGDKAASMIVSEESYDVFETTIDSHIVKMSPQMRTYSSTSPRRNSRHKPSGARPRSAGNRCTSSIASAPASVPSSNRPVLKTRKVSSRWPTRNI